MSHSTPPAGAVEASGRSPRPDARLPHLERLANVDTIWVEQGSFHVSASPNEVLTTVLGSCIAVCIRDPAIAFGGMNHFLLPDAPQPTDGLPTIELRYGSYSIERLINAIVSRGGHRERLEIKVFGGSNILGTSNIGHHNADFVEAYLRKEGLSIAAKDLRGNCPRKVIYFPTTGLVLMSNPRDRSAAIILDEAGKRLSRRLLTANISTVEIFQPPPARKRNMGGS